MTTYYVGKGGNDGNAGTSWATRKLTLNGAEDVRVVPGDTVIIGPGIYRETLQCDVTGTAGNPITYEGDRSGYRTDGIGGKVIITGSDDDISEVRTHCIDTAGLVAFHYRTWRNLIMGWTDDAIMAVDGGVGDKDGWVIEDCVFMNVNSHGIYASTIGDDWAIRRCMFIAVTYAIRTSGSAHNGATGDVLESCVFLGGHASTTGFYVFQGTWEVLNCTFIGCYDAVNAAANNGGAQYMSVENCIFNQNFYGMRAAAPGDLVEDYNGLYNNAADRDADVAVGANSVTYAPLWETPLLQEGVKTPVRFPFLSQWSAYRRLTDSGTVPSGGDLFGLPFPATNGKRSWGAIQYQDFERDGSVYRGASGASGLMNDASIKTFLVPVGASSATLEVYARRGANYAGSNPRVVIRQPGQSEIEVVDAGAAGAWNLLTHTWTPAASPPWVQVMLQSRNSAGAGDYTVNWDDLKVEVDA